VKKIIFGVIGFPLLALGVILIPLPGPGLIVCFLALFILSFAFDFAHSYLDKIKKEFKKIYAQAKARAEKFENRGSE
jgi:uncharacterized protein (TIGR02611 family)